MPTVMTAGAVPVPVIYASWEEWRRDRVVEPAPAPLVAGAFCALCWGQRRILAPAANGEGLVPRWCEACSGTGTAPPIR